MYNRFPITSSPKYRRRELRCSRCEYLLQGLDPFSECPECGQPIQESIDSAKAFNDASHLYGVVSVLAVLIIVFVGVGFYQLIGNDLSMGEVFGIIFCTCVCNVFSLITAFVCFKVWVERLPVTKAIVLARIGCALMLVWDVVLFSRVFG